MVWQQSILVTGNVPGMMFVYSEVTGGGFVHFFACGIDCGCEFRDSHFVARFSLYKMVSGH